MADDEVDDAILQSQAQTGELGVYDALGDRSALTADELDPRTGKSFGSGGGARARRRKERSRPVPPAARVAAGTTPTGPAPEPPTSSRRWIVAAAVVVIVLLLIGIAALASGGSDDDTDSTAAGTSEPSASGGSTTSATGGSTSAPTGGGVGLITEQLQGTITSSSVKPNGNPAVVFADHAQDFDPPNLAVVACADSDGTKAGTATLDEGECVVQLVGYPDPIPVVDGAVSDEGTVAGSCSNAVRTVDLEVTETEDRDGVEVPVGLAGTVTMVGAGKPESDGFMCVGVDGTWEVEFGA